ncbi:MAG: HEAT repeat domain-containing protein, partial [Verrucomicrobiota bacterium]
NYLGDLFSFDSDMEWHVSLPWYRPVRLNHWAIGGDQGWQEVGAYPPYYIDCLPGILEIGRGSPTWGTFYEHAQFPEKYSEAYLVCDYRWKRESNDQYATTGRLLAFFLRREGASWNASMEELARPKPGARDSAGALINFALVDVQVAPDGSLFLTDHNQGIWRIFYQPANAVSLTRLPEIVPQFKPLPTDSTELFQELVALPQPGSERSRLREEAIRAVLVNEVDTKLQRVVLDSALPVKERLRALRLLAPGFASLPAEFINHLTTNGTVEMRAQAAWLLGIRGQRDTAPLVIKLLNDSDPFVRRRAAEALTRLPWPEATDALISRLADPVRLVRYVAMVALAHRPAGEWFEKAVAQSAPQAQMRALVASLICREAPSAAAVRRIVTSLLDMASVSDDRLDLLRVLGLFQKPLRSDPELTQRIFQHLLRNFPDSDRDLRWEQIRLLGEYRCDQAFPKLLSQLESERDEVTQFHLAQAIARLREGWNADEETRLVRWFLGTQRGWFTEFAGKGVEFPDFWATALTDFGKHHQDALLRQLPSIDFTTQLGGVIVNLMAEGSKPEESLIALYRSNEKPDAKLKIVRALKKVQSPTLSAFLRSEYQPSSDPNFRGALLQSLAAQPVEAANFSLVIEGLRHFDPDVVRACAEALPRFKPELDEDLANLLLSRLGERRDLFQSVQKALVALGKAQPPGFTADRDPNRRPDDATRKAGIDFWKNWYEQRFQKKFEPRLSTAIAERSDEEIHRFILNEDARAGNSVRGAKVYESVQCNTCHGGGVTPGREGRIFGPDLAGVTRRLSRQDLADAIVYPSKQVPDRFKGYEVELKDSTPLTGFITEQNDESVTLVDREQVHRIPKSRVRAITPQAISLMPDRLVNRLSSDEIRDLLAFLDEGAAAKVPAK